MLAPTLTGRQYKTYMLHVVHIGTAYQPCKLELAACCQLGEATAHSSGWCYSPLACFIFGGL